MIIEFIFGMSEAEAIDLMKNSDIKEKIVTQYFFKYKEKCIWKNSIW